MSRNFLAALGAILAVSSLTHCGPIAPTIDKRALLDQASRDRSPFAPPVEPASPQVVTYSTKLLAQDDYASRTAQLSASRLILSMSADGPLSDHFNEFKKTGKTQITIVTTLPDDSVGMFGVAVPKKIADDAAAGEKPANASSSDFSEFIGALDQGFDTELRHDTGNLWTLRISPEVPAEVRSTVLANLVGVTLAFKAEAPESALPAAGGGAL